MTKVIQYILLGTFCLGLLTFILMFFKSNWRTNLVGRYIMYFMVTMLFVFVYIMFGSFLGKYPGKTFVDMIFLISTNFAAWKIVWLLYKIRRDGKVKDDKIIRGRQNSR